MNKIIYKYLMISSATIIMGCVTNGGNNSTPYTIIQPDDNYYSDESDKREFDENAKKELTNRHFSGSLKKISPRESHNAVTADSSFRSSTDYTVIAAKHIYKINKSNIYKGILPPLLKGVGVIEVTVDRHGRVKNMNWLRRPNHVPAIATQIESLVRNAEPYPIPSASQNDIKFTETWLWHENGKVQLRTLTEGQI